MSLKLPVSVDSMIICPACHRSFDPAEGSGIPYKCARCGSRVVGAYCDLTEIGRGAMGTVYRARRPDMGDRTVAIKIPKQATQQIHDRFEREIAASARLQHDNIVRAFDRGQEQGRPYLVMEYVEGQSLREMVETGHPLDVATVARIVRGVAAGLAHAARHGAVNRDIKPENILVSRDGVAKIMDYGLALMRGLDSDDGRVTRPGVLLGTPGFMPPEQFTDPHDVTVSADVYALGGTAVCALANRMPFRGSSSQELLDQHTHAARPTIRDVRPDVSEAFEQLLHRLMAVEPDQRPAPEEILAAIDAMMPALVAASDLPDALPIAERVDGERFAGDSATAAYDGPHGDDEEIEVHCPGCNEAYYLRGASLGKMMRCTNPDCGERFRVEAFTDDEPPIADVVSTGRDVFVEGTAGWETSDSDSLPVIGSQPARPQTGSSLPDLPMLPAAAIVAEVPPPVQEDVSTYNGTGDPTLPVLPVAAIVDDVPPQQIVDEPASTADDAKPARRKSPRAKFAMFAAGCLAVMVIAAGARFLLVRPPDPEVIWKEIQQGEYEDKKWTLAEKRFQEFAEQFPDNPHTAHVPFFLRMCDTGRDIYSSTADYEKGLAKLKQVFLDYRDTKAYDLYRVDIHSGLTKLVERLVEQAEKTSNPERLKLAREALELLTTVAGTMPDDWVPRELANREALVEAAEKKVEQANTKNRVLEALATISDLSVMGSSLDDSYARAERLLDEQPELRDDKEVKDSLAAAYASESQRVRYEPVEDTAAIESTAPDRNAETLFVVWDEPAAETGYRAVEAADVFVALARGVLYAFDSRGRLLWAHRLGVDSYRLPVSVPASRGSPPALIAVSTVDSRLLSIAATTGKILWQYQAGTGQELAAPLTISRIRPAPNEPEEVRGLLPTADGEIHVLELARGREIGRFITGQPMTAGGVFDPTSKLVFFPADSRRVFAIDPTAINNSSPAARSVLFTNHAGGTLRSQPVVVGPYLILAEAQGLDQTRLRAFQVSPKIGFRDVHADAVRATVVRGWSWFTPPTTPDRVTVVTDQGQLGVFGVNLDNPAEALFPIIHDGKRNVPSLAVSDAFRSLAIHSDENLLWLSAGGKLRLLALDILNQSIRPVWPAEGEEGPAAGIPLHEAQLDDSLERIFITTKSTPGYDIQFTSVDAMSGERVWRRQLGVSPAGDPEMLRDGVLIVDRSGRTLEVKLPKAAGDQPALVTSDPFGARPPGDLMTVTSDAGSKVLVTADRELPMLYARPLIGSSEATAWSAIRLPARMFGRPAVVGETLVVPCDDRRLYRRRLDGAPEPAGNELQYQWTAARNLAPDRAVRLYPADANTILLVDGQRVQFLQYGVSAGVRQWKPIGDSYHASAAVIGDPLLVDNQVILADAQSRIVVLNREALNVEVKSWQLDGRITTPPQSVAGQLIAVTDERKLVAITNEVNDSNDGPSWQVGPFGGRILGRPYHAGATLLVTDESGQVTAVRATDGERRPLLSLPRGDVPAAAAVPFGRGRFLIPLVDGTLRMAALETKPAAPEKSP